MVMNDKIDPEVVLETWRTKILNLFLTILVVAAAPAWGVVFFNFLKNPSSQFIAMFTLFSLGYACLIVLAAFRRIPIKVRIWGLMALGYAGALVYLDYTWMSGGGPWFLLMLPVIGFIIIGVKAGILLSILSGLILAIFVTLYNTGLLVPLIESEINPWTPFSIFVMFLVVIMTLLILFHRFQEGLISTEHKTQKDLRQVQQQLEEQNSTLEKKVEERTEALLKSNKIQTALYKIAEAGSTSPDINEFYKQVHLILSELMYAGNIFIALYDESSGLLSFPYFVDEKDPPLPTQPLVNFHGMTSYVIRTGNSITHGWDQFNELMDKHEIALEGTFNEDGIGAPLKADGKILGAIFVQSYTKGIHYTAQDDEVLAFCAQHIATALTRLRAIEAERQHNHNLAILNSVSEAMVQTLDIKTLTRIVGDKLREIFDADSAMIMLLDKPSNLINVPYEYDRDEGGYIDYVESFPLGTGLASKVILSGQALVLGSLEEEIANGAYFPPEITQKGSGYVSQSWLGVPITTEGKVLGLIALADARPYFFSEYHVGLLKMLSSNVGVAIEKGRLFDETQRLVHVEQQRVEELQIINSIQLGLAGKPNFQYVVDLVGDKLREVLKTDDLLITWYVKKTNLLHFLYLYEHGQRLDVSPLPPRTGGKFELMQKTHQPIVLNNKSDHEKFNLTILPGTDQSVSSVSVPIIHSEQVLGFIQLENFERENAYGESELRLLTTIAGSLGAALENARLFGETQYLLKETEQRNAELAIINSVQQALASKLDMASIYDLVGDKIGEIFSADVVMIGIYDSSQKTMKVPYMMDHGERFFPATKQPGPLYDILLKDHQPVLIHTIKEVEEELAKFSLSMESENIGGPTADNSFIYVPLLVGNEVTGVISIGKLPENAFNESDVRLLTTLASSMSVALENARLFDETQRLLKETEQRNAELAIINSVQQALASKLDMASIYDLVGDKVREIFSADVVMIGIYDSSQKTMKVPYMLDHGERYFPGARPIQVRPWSEPLYKDHQPVLIHTYKEMGEIENIAGPTVDNSFIYVPLLVGNEFTGVITVGKLPENAFNESDVRLLTTLASSMSVALENARLFDETQRLLKETEQRAVELDTINTISRELAGELGFEPLVHLIGEEMRVVFEADIAYVALLDETSGTINFPYTYGEDFSPMKVDEGLTGKIIQTGAPLLINQELDRQSQGTGSTIYGTQALSYLGVPIFVSGKPAGVISVQSTKREGVFSADDQNLLNTLAANVGTALHNAQLFTELENQKRFSDVLVDFLPDATLVIDREGKVLAWNRAMEEMTGIKAEEMVGKDNYEYALPFYGERRPILIDLVLLPDQEFEEKYALIERRGKTLWGETYTPMLREGRYLYATASGFHDSKGNMAGAIETIRDITERKNNELELKRAKEAADAANATKSAFLANMSHELRTPLNAIIGFTRIVRRKADGLIPEKQTENLDKVLTSADHLLNLINTVLDIAKIEAGRMDVLAANFRISSLVDQCSNTVQPMLRPGVRFEKYVDENLTTIYSDQDKIRQIVLNLVSNAAKFTHEGSIRLSAIKAGDNLQISVSDTGIGISDEALPRIFKEFQQADNTTTRQYGGTGLGLSISRNLAHLLGGDLTVKSEEGKGSIFTLEIPLRFGNKPIAPTIEAEPALAKAALPVSQSGSTKKRILVIDNDPDAVYLLQENLNQENYVIMGARNGQEGLQKAVSEQPQVILLDVILPVVDGWQILRELKGNPLTAEIPVILLTIVDKKALGFQMGAASYLLKPLDPVAVRDALNRVLLPDLPSPKKVLVVDDDPDVVEMLRQTLPEAEFKLDSAPDGVTGLEAIAAARPDILLLDIMMPRLDGFEVIKRLRSDPNTAKLPIIVISAKDLSESESALLKETVTAVMKKQAFQGEDLYQEIQRILSAAPDQGKL